MSTWPKERLDRLQRFAADPDVSTIAVTPQEVLDAFHEGEIAFARKVLAVSSGVHKVRGFTRAKRLKLITNKCMEIIPDALGIDEEAV